MKQFIGRMQNLSQKAAELKAAVQQVPPKVAEIRAAVTATTDQLQQLKHEIQFSVADLKADQADHLGAALQEVHQSATEFSRAGFVLAGVDVEISPVQRALVHLQRTEEVPDATLRTLMQANQHRRTTRAILASLLQAQQMAQTVELGELIYDEIIVGIGPIPSVRLCWRRAPIERPTPQANPPPIPAAPPLAAFAPAPPPAEQTATPHLQASFGPGAFFERREPPSAVKIEPAAPSASVPAVEPVAVPQNQSQAEPKAAADPLARFKKMPVLGR